MLLLMSRCMSRWSGLALPALALAGAVGGGCAAPAPAGDAALAVPADRYAEVFDTAREVLRDARFDLERVDARAGVITTRPKKTIGLFSPWDAEQSTLGQEVDDLFNRQRRIVRITFEGPPSPPDPDAATAAETPVQAGGSAGSADGLVMRISVVVEREQQPGWRLESTSVRLNSRATDLALADRGLTPWHTAAVAQDPVYAARLADEVRRRTGPGTPDAPPAE